MTSDTPVSVIVAAYNHERFVAEALRSLAAQTYPDLELIVLDDGSTDETFARVQDLLPELQSRFTRIEVATKAHEGPAKTIARCLDLARSDLVFILDSDDVALPEAIERLLPLLQTPGVALAVGDNEYIDAAGYPGALEANGESFRTLLAYHTRNRAGFSTERDFGTYASLIEGNYVPNGWLLRKSLANSVGGYSSDFLLDDWSLLLRLTKQYRLIYAHAVLVKYRLHGRNTARVQGEQMFLDTVRILLQERDYCAAHGLLAEWWAHASQVFGALTSEQLERTDLLAALLPGVGEAALAHARALCVAFARAKEKSPPRPPVLEAPPGSLGQRIHLYALCWNDERMLPFFFRHYDKIVQRYVIFDDGSTDGSLELLRAHPRVEVRQFVRSHPDSFVLSELTHYDNAWKESRGTADWVLLVDVDEHLFHPDLGVYLSRCLSQGVTAIPALGFEMLSDDFPGEDEMLCRTRTHGAAAAEMSKLCVFSPDAVQELHHVPGGHASAPVGRIVGPPRDELLLLHYKLMGMEQAAERHAALCERLGATDLENHWGIHWTASADEFAAAVAGYRARLVDVSLLGSEPARSFPAPRWWVDCLPRLEDRVRVAELEADRSRLQDELATAAEISRGRALSLQESERALAEARNLHTQEYARLGDALARVAALESSRTWRWTRPARVVAGWFVRTFTAPKGTTGQR